METQRTELLPGVFLTTLRTDKFKSDCLSVNLLTPLNRETVSKNALLPRVLLRGSAFHPDMESLAAAGEELYGANIFADVRTRGEILCVGLCAGFLDDRFTPQGEKLLEPVTRLLGEVLLSPATKGGLLRRDYVEGEKEKLISDIRAKINNKRAYALSRLLSEMCCYEDYGTDDMGTEESAAAVGYVELTRWYHDLLRCAPVEIIYCGAADHARVSAACTDALITLPRGEIDYDLGTDVRMNAVTAEPREFDEEMDVAQSQLCLGFRVGEAMEDPDFAALGVFNAIYGGSMTSKLFDHVREKLSLCYDASSYTNTFKGVMLVSAGIAPENRAQAQREILAQLDDVRAGEISDEELENARKFCTGSLRADADSPGTLENFWLGQTLKGLDYGPEEMAALCEMVSREDVVAIARGIELDSVYFLHPPEQAEEETEEEEAGEDAAD